MSWRKSSYSGEHECVEVRLDRLSQIRDSKDRAGGALTVTTRSWDAFVASLAHGSHRAAPTTVRWLPHRS
jgi:hypothetical protein